MLLVIHAGRTMPLPRPPRPACSPNEGGKGGPTGGNTDQAGQGKARQGNGGKGTGESVSVSAVKSAPVFICPSTEATGRGRAPAALPPPADAASGGMYADVRVYMSQDTRLTCSAVEHRSDVDDTGICRSPLVPTAEDKLATLGRESKTHGVLLVLVRQNLSALHCNYCLLHVQGEESRASAGVGRANAKGSKGGKHAPKKKHVTRPWRQRVSTVLRFFASLPDNWERSGSHHRRLFLVNYSEAGLGGEHPPET